MRCSELRVQHADRQDDAARLAVPVLRTMYRIVREGDEPALVVGGGAPVCR